MISDLNCEGAGGGHETVAISSFDELSDAHRERLEAMTAKIGEMIAKRMVDKMPDAMKQDIDPRDMYSACLVEQIAFLALNQEASNLQVLALARRLEGKT